MKERYDLVENLRTEVAGELKRLIKDDKMYKELLKKLLVQSMLRLMERNLYVRARADQVELIKAVLPESEKLFTGVLEVSGKSMESCLSISEHRL